MFIENDFYKEYMDIISKNKKTHIDTGYYEKHHIIPKSLGGTNKKDNIVYLSAKDHFRCHKLLVNFTSGTDNQKMWSALWRMMNKQSYSQKRDYDFTSEEYETARINHSIAHSIRMSGKNNPFYGKKHTEETKKSMSASKKGKTYEEIFGEEFAKDMREKRKNESHNRVFSEETKEKIRNQKLGKKRDPELMKMIGEARKGSKQSLETLEKKRIARELNKKTCEHCGKIVVMTNYKRWHGDNCKNIN